MIKKLTQHTLLIALLGTTPAHAMMGRALRSAGTLFKTAGTTQAFKQTQKAFLQPVIVKEHSSRFNPKTIGALAVAGSLLAYQQQDNAIVHAEPINILFMMPFLLNPFLGLAATVIKLLPGTQGQGWAIENTLTFLKDLAYIAKQNGDEENAAKITSIADFLEKGPGFCQALSPLWLYSKDRSHQPQKYTANDVVAFDKNYQYITGWHPLTPSSSSSEQIKSLAIFIRHIIVLYNTFDPEYLLPFFIDNTPVLTENNNETYILNMAKLLEKITHTSFKIHSVQNQVLTKEGLRNLLTTTAQPGHMLYISLRNPAKPLGGGHAVALYVTPDGKYCFYDPNIPYGELKNTTLDTVINALWRPEYECMLTDTTGKMLFGVQSFSAEEELRDLPRS